MDSESPTRMEGSEDPARKDTGLPGQVFYIEGNIIVAASTSPSDLKSVKADIQRQDVQKYQPPL